MSGATEAPQRPGPGTRLVARLAAPYVVGMASRVIGQVMSFVSVAVASRYLDLAVFGDYALAWAAAVIGNTFVFTGFYQALLRSPDAARDRDTLFWLNAGLGAGFALAIAAFGLAAGGGETARGLALLALAPIPLLIAPQAWWEAQLVRDRRVRAASLYVLAAEVLALVTVVWLLARGWGIEALIASRYVAVLAGVVLTGGLVRRLPRLRLRREAARLGTATATPLWGTTGVALFSNYGTDLILGAFAPAAVIGAYRGGARIAITASDLVLQPLGVLSWSRFTRIEKEGGDGAARRAAWAENMALGAAILWPLSAFVAILAAPLVTTVLDETWLPAASVVAILSLSRAVLFFSALLEPVLTTTGQGRRQFAIRLWGAAALLAGLMGFARFGAEAAAWVHLASSALMALLAMTGMARALDAGPRALLAPFGPATALTLVTLAILAAMGPLVAGLGPVTSLALQSVAVGAGWTLGAGLFMARGQLRLPVP